MAGRTRRALIQVHLWLGIGLGLYVVMMSVTGSALVARRQLTRHWIPDAIATEGRARLDSVQLRQRAALALPGYSLVTLSEPPPPRRPAFPHDAPPYAPGSVAAPAEAVFVRGGQRVVHRFDPFTGRDLGELMPAPFRAYLKVVDLHNDLLGGRVGRYVNGMAAIATTLLLLTGLVIWWPARLRQWPASVSIRRGAPWRTQLREWHNVLGIWPFLLLLLWSLSGIYFAFPEPFEALKEWLYPPDAPDAIRGDDLLAAFTSLHFGRFGGAGVLTAWILLGLVPAALSITGAIMWWYRVLQPAWRRAGHR